MARQRIHVRHSKYGRKFLAGARRKAVEVPKAVRTTVLKEQMSSYAQELKRTGRVRLPELGILRIKVKKARPAHTGMNPFTGKKQKFAAKPKQKIVKFRAAKALKEELN